MRRSRARWRRGTGTRDKRVSAWIGFREDSVSHAFAAKLAEAVRRLKPAAGLEEGATQGPLIDDRAVEKVEEHVADARARGARDRGRRPPQERRPIFEPTVLVDATPAMLIAREETFGPVAAALFRFKTEAEAIAMANDTEFGLQLLLRPRRRARLRVAEGLKSGMVGINTGLISTEVAPFGGVKESGLGREGLNNGSRNSSKPNTSALEESASHCLAAPRLCTRRPAAGQLVNLDDRQPCAPERPVPASASPGATTRAAVQRARARGGADGRRRPSRSAPRSVRTPRLSAELNALLDVTELHAHFGIGAHPLDLLALGRHAVQAVAFTIVEQRMVSHGTAGCRARRRAARDSCQAGSPGTRPGEPQMTIVRLDDSDLGVAVSIAGEVVQRLSAPVRQRQHQRGEKNADVDPIASPSPKPAFSASAPMTKGARAPARRPAL